MQTRQLRGWDGGAWEASGVPLSVHFFFRTLLRFGGSALAVAGCSACGRDGLHIPRRLESRWGTPERGRGGQKHPGSSLVHSEPREQPPTPGKWDCTSCISKLGPTPPPRRKTGSGAATEPGCRDGEQGRGGLVLTLALCSPAGPSSRLAGRGLQVPHQGPTAPLLWQLQGSWLREVLPLRLWKVRGLLAAHGSGGRGPPL